jgi:hypothetical protein
VLTLTDTHTIPAETVDEGQWVEIKNIPVEVIDTHMDRNRHATVIRIVGRATDGTFVSDFYEPDDDVPLAANPDTVRAALGPYGDDWNPAHEPA